MNIINVKCPNCGASLRVEGNSRSMIYCQFCGTSVYLETAHNTGYDLEMGRREAIADTADNFVNILQDIKGPVLELPGDYQSFRACEATLKSYKNSIIKYSSTTTPYIVPSIISGCIVFFLFITFSSFLWFMFWAILCLGIYLISGQICVHKKKSYETLVYSKEKELQSLKAVVNNKEEILAKYPNVLIPKKYRNTKAFDYFINLFKSRQAFTLEEAYSKYEAYLKQEENLQLQRTQIELQQKQIKEMQRLQRQMQLQNKRR